MKDNLAKVLKIEDGEVKAKYDWRAAFDSVFASPNPVTTYADYEKYCRKRGVQPSQKEWNEIRFLVHDETTGD